MNKAYLIAILLAVFSSCIIYGMESDKEGQSNLFAGLPAELNVQIFAQLLDSDFDQTLKNIFDMALIDKNFKDILLSEQYINDIVKAYINKYGREGKYNIKLWLKNNGVNLNNPLVYTIVKRTFDTNEPIIIGQYHKPNDAEMLAFMEYVD